MSNVQPEDRLTHAIPTAQQTVAEETAACQHRIACTKRDIAVVAGPDFAYRAFCQGDFFDLVARHPDPTLRHKLALKLGMQTNAGHGRGKRRQ